MEDLYSLDYCDFRMLDRDGHRPPRPKAVIYSVSKIHRNNFQITGLVDHLAGYEEVEFLRFEYGDLETGQAEYFYARVLRPGHRRYAYFESGGVRLYQFVRLWENRVMMHTMSAQYYIPAVLEIFRTSSPFERHHSDELRG